MAAEQLSRQRDGIAERPSLKATAYRNQAVYRRPRWLSTRFGCGPKILLSHSIGAAITYCRARLARAAARLTRWRTGQKRRRTQISRPEQRRVEQRFAGPQPPLEPWEIPLHQCPQCHKSTQILIRWRNELATGFDELINQRFRSCAARRITASQDEQVAELERCIDPRRCHCRFEACLERDRVRMRETPEAIMLFTITRAAEDESETAVKRWALLIWIALNQDINVVWEIEVLFEYPQCPIKELAQSILTFHFQKTSHFRGSR
jgi:hypothetical protein